MGGGNAQKTAMARAKNLAKAKADAKGGGGKEGLAKRTNNMDLKCTVCMQCFPSTQVKAAQSHVENKHPKSDFATCFPMCKVSALKWQTGKETGGIDIPNENNRG